MKALTRETKVLFGCVLAVGLAGLPSSLVAQVQRVPPAGTPRLMVSPLHGSEKGLGSQATDEVINKLTSDINYRELYVIPKDFVCKNLEQSGFNCDSTLDPVTSRLLAVQLRADEYLEGTVTKTPTGYKLDARLMLPPDNPNSSSLVQPLPPAEGRKLGDVASQLSKSLQAARKQIPNEKKCRDALRGNDPKSAVAAAEAAIAAYPQSTIARVCLANAYVALKMPADSVIAVTSKVIQLDPHSTPALTLAANAYKAKYDQTKDTTTLDQAVDTWAALLASDPKNTRLVEDVTEKIAATGKAERAKPIIVQAVQDNPGDPSLIHLKWLILQATKDYAEAAETGEEMIRADTAAADSTFFVRQAALYALAKQPQKAAETTARGVAKFKNNATLWSLDAQTQRLAGQTQAAVQAADQAIQLNPKTEHAYLRKAQAQVDLNQPDSALVSLRAALANGEDTATVGQFVLALGSKAYQQADSLKPPQLAAYQRAMSILSYADSIAPTAQEKFVLGVAAFKAGDLAVRSNVTSKQCDLAQTAQDAFVTAQVNVAAGGQTDPQVAQQILGAVQQYDPAVQSQIKRFCKTSKKK